MKKLYSKIYSIFIRKNDKFTFEPPFGGRRGNVRTTSIAPWKACGRLPIRYNCAFVAIVLTVETL